MYSLFYLFKFHLEVVSPREPSTNIQETHLEAQQILKKISVQLPNKAPPSVCDELPTGLRYIILVLSKV